MLDIKFIRENPAKVKEACRAKKEEVDIDRLLELDKKYLRLLQKTEELRRRHNEKSHLYHKLISGRSKPDKEIRNARANLDDSKIKLRQYEEETRKAKEKRDRLLLEVPNLPAPDVKFGQSEQDNEVIRTWGEKPKPAGKPLDYLTLAESLDLIDVKRASKVSGTRFGYLKNEAALLEFALVNFALTTLRKEGFTPIIPPMLMKVPVFHNLGYSEHLGNENYYYVLADPAKKSRGEEEEGYYLAGTSEHSVVPYFMDEVLKVNELPKRFVSFSTCFRREAGSYGKDTKGILRVHQFDKVEMVSFTRAEESLKEHNYFLALEEKLVQALGIPYRVVKMCSSDLGNPAARKFDIECWIPSQEKYRETHSTSCCTNYQARRLNVKYRNKDGKKNFVHTVNGTAFAIGRTIIALIENFQQKDGSILIPKVLHPYMKGKKITKHE